MLLLSLGTQVENLPCFNILNNTARFCNCKIGIILKLLLLDLIQEQGKKLPQCLPVREENSLILQEWISKSNCE